MLRVDNKYYTWEELVEEFPDKWVVVENPVLDDAGFAEAGELIAVCDDNEVDDVIIECYKSGKDFDYRRTTTRGNVGIIDIIGFGIEVE